MNKKVLGIIFLLLAHFALFLDGKKNYYQPVWGQDFRELYEIQEGIKNNIEEKENKCRISNSTFVQSWKNEWSKITYDLERKTWYCLLSDNTVVRRGWLSKSYGDEYNHRRIYEAEKERDIFDENNYYSKIIGVLNKPKYYKIYNYGDTSYSLQEVIKIEGNELVEYFCKVYKTKNTDWKCYKDEPHEDIITRKILGIKRDE